MKLKIDIRSIIKYIYVLIIFLNVFLVYQIYKFAVDNVLSAINPEEVLMHLQDRKYSEDLNVKKFEIVVEKIKQKKNTRSAQIIIEEQEVSSSSEDILQ